MERGTKRINAKSIMGVMMLAAGKGAKVTVDTEGERAEEAMAAILNLIADKFGEGE
jgi:phosphocarrier protein